MLTAMRGDIRAARERDPAAPTALEVIFCYPGVHAVWGHRLAHWLWQRGARLLARAAAEFTRILTGVDIHPGAVIGARVFIDHATGVVIGNRGGRRRRHDLSRRHSRRQWHGWRETPSHRR